MNQIINDFRKKFQKISKLLPRKNSKKGKIQRLLFYN